MKCSLLQQRNNNLVQWGCEGKRTDSYLGGGGTLLPQANHIIKMWFIEGNPNFKNRGREFSQYQMWKRYAPYWWSPETRRLASGESLFKGTWEIILRAPLYKPWIIFGYSDFQSRQSLKLNKLVPYISEAYFWDHV